MLLSLRERCYEELPAMADALAFDVTTAAQWFLRDDERLEYPWEDYGGLTPPYPELWMELRYPEQLQTGAGLSVFAGHAQRAYAGAPGNFVNVDGCLGCDTEPHWVVIRETYGAGRRRIAVFNRWVMTLDVCGKYLRYLAQPMPWAPLA